MLREQAHSLGEALRIVELAEHGNTEEMKVLRQKHSYIHALTYKANDHQG